MKEAEANASVFSHIRFLSKAEYTVCLEKGGTPHATLAKNHSILTRVRHVVLYHPFPLLGASV